MSKFSERLAELRTEKNLSRKALARAMNVSDVAIGRWESGTQSPSLDNVIALAKFFGVSMDYLSGLTNYQ